MVIGYLVWNYADFFDFRQIIDKFTNRVKFESGVDLPVYQVRITNADNEIYPTVEVSFEASQHGCELLDIKGMVDGIIDQMYNYADLAGITNREWFLTNLSIQVRLIEPGTLPRLGSAGKVKTVIDNRLRK